MDTDLLDVTDTAALRALGHPARMRLLLSVGADGATVSQLSTRLGTNKGNVAHHLAVLERAGLVTKERSGRRKVVRTNMEALRLARGLLDEYEALWRGRIDRMTDLITRSKEIET